ncbi:hypothetical protein [Dinghuibacter silviterrae]|uniref:HTH cro/C1-type domain-containing protein n=1 Tax=Dinghuibacter silviterrae TaxID=1539049 RepID=A0A4R8DIB5_9BACT|nr:hypothetical protein [Dinghuibacter silviterrae]TDW96896.1 hypothetical protein EDB95_4732 [Dinghuibacter silviterrae]
MKKDNRYLAVQSILEREKSIKFNELFDIIPRTVVASDMAQDYRTFAGKVRNPESFTIAELASLSRLFEVDPHKLLELILPHVRLPKKKL